MFPNPGILAASDGQTGTKYRHGAYHYKRIYFNIFKIQIKNIEN